MATKKIEAKTAPAATKPEKTAKGAKEPAAAKGAKETAAKPAKKEKEAGARAQHAAKKIKVLAKENPRREGSQGHATFAVYKNGMTVGEAIEAGADAGYIRSDVNRGYISLS